MMVKQLTLSSNILESLNRKVPNLALPAPTEGFIQSPVRFDTVIEAQNSFLMRVITTDPQDRNRYGLS